MKSGIYLIKNTINNKLYVGSAVNIDKRWKEHKRYLNRGKHHSILLQRAWDKYGEQTFKFEILEEVSNPEHLLAYEQVYLDYYKSYECDRGYNIHKVAGSPLGMKLSQETKQKLREINTGKKLSEEHKQKLREAKIGLKRSEETKRKIKETKTGKKLSEETKTLMREAHRKSNNNKYYCFNKQKKKYLVRIWGNFIGWYNTEEEAKQAVIINLKKLKVQQIVLE
jgi:group I intron endonuclease